MATIVKHYDKKTGTTRVYESVSHYDPITKQSRPKRKYLGILNPETGELIPSSGRPGRKTNKLKNDPECYDKELLDKIDKLEKVISKKNEEISSLYSKINSLETAVKTYKQTCDSISKSLTSLPQ